MPFIAECECGLQIQGDAQTNSHLLGKKVIHWDLERGHVAEIQTRPIELRGKSPDTGLPCHPSENRVVWMHPGTGEVRYPGRTDTPMPRRYANQGYERHEIRNLRKMEQFEKAKGVRNEATWFDRGSGGSFDGIK